MIKQVSKFSCYTPIRVKFLAGALRACKVRFDVYHVVLDGRHGYYVFLTHSKLHDWMVYTASDLHIPICPHPLLDDEESLCNWLAIYISKLPLSI